MTSTTNDDDVAPNDKHHDELDANVDNMSTSELTQNSSVFDEAVDTMRSIIMMSTTHDLCDDKKDMIPKDSLAYMLADFASEYHRELYNVIRDKVKSDIENHE
jgi:hypothetical protein